MSSGPHSAIFMKLCEPFLKQKDWTFCYFEPCSFSQMLWSRHQLFSIHYQYLQFYPMLLLSIIFHQVFNKWFAKPLLDHWGIIILDAESLLQSDRHQPNLQKLQPLKGKILYSFWEHISWVACHCTICYFQQLLCEWYIRTLVKLHEWRICCKIMVRNGRWWAHNLHLF